MITCVCRACGGQWAVADELAGEEVSCDQCGARSVAPLELACEDEWARPEGPTLTLAELEALRRELARGSLA